MKKLLLLSFICLIAIPLRAQRCAVLDFQIGTGVNEEEIDGLTYNFRANFNIEGYRIIPKEPMYGAIEKLGFNRTDMTQQQMLKLGRQLEAKYVVVGTMNKFMDEYSVDIRAVDVSTGVTVATDGAAFDKSNYRVTMENLASSLGKKLATSSSLRNTPVPSSATSSSSRNQVREGFVDLGLSVKWAECNLGATSPEQYGDYYSWGETSPKFNYSNSTYDYLSNPSVLPLSRDAANVKLGGRCRMPTDAEWTELRTKCKWTWTQYKGVYGYRVESVSGNCIFLPAAGWRSDGQLNNAGSSGNYWSSSLDAGNPSYAYGGYFDSSYVNRSYTRRYDGQSVRPVSE